MFVRQCIISAFILSASSAWAGMSQFDFTSIEGLQMDTASWEGRPVLVVNTASRCGFTPQYDDLQALHEKYSDQGLVVLAVPSNDFRQELSSAEAVKDFCAVNFDLTLPMTDISKVKGTEAHPFYRWVKETAGFEPGWNFNKVLISGEGEVVATYGSMVKPTSPKLVSQIEQELAD
ncbi:MULTISPECIES: glutathione peroxidase [Donghicola]|jgi:glutathione peroxidase|uniref:glutathione peroxidase n=1 Tax=Donghicola sp. TaxID=1929294 RepID=UPI0025D16AB1|nr:MULTISPECIES: glutathione peroxidase [Donghicola]MCI5041439.1 glutathione peroxidase [Donghicola eburneus]MCT4578348.1 glutathione peroxidase [Donghicola sp.]